MSSSILADGSTSADAVRHNRLTLGSITPIAVIQMPCVACIIIWSQKAACYDQRLSHGSVTRMSQSSGQLPRDWEAGRSSAARTRSRVIPGHSSATRSCQAGRNGQVDLAGRGRRPHRRGGFAQTNAQRLLHDDRLSAKSPCKKDERRSRKRDRGGFGDGVHLQADVVERCAVASH